MVNEKLLQSYTVIFTEYSNTGVQITQKLRIYLKMNSVPLVILRDGLDHDVCVSASAYIKI